MTKPGSSVTPICTDDFGTSVYLGRYTERPVWADKAISYPAVVPGVKASYLDSEAGREGHRFNAAAFQENDANCNTCKHLIRQAGRKDRGGFLYGKCGGTPAKHPYSLNPRSHMAFPPDDYMGMTCWEAR